MNGIVLTKGDRINLSKQVTNLADISVVMGWKRNTVGAKSSNVDFDVDVSAFICKYNEEHQPVLISNDWFVFYGKLTSPDRSVVHQGDNTTGGEGDCETINVNLLQCSNVVQEISFIVTIHDAVNRKQNFGQIHDAYVKLINNTDGSVIAKFDLSTDFSSETAVQLGSLYRNNEQDWLFQAVGVGYKKDLTSFVVQYGGVVASK